jgi:hypothetical protein
MNHLSVTVYHIYQIDHVDPHRRPHNLKPGKRQSCVVMILQGYVFNCHRAQAFWTQLDAANHLQPITIQPNTVVN